MKKRINTFLVILLAVVISIAPIPISYTNAVTVEAHSGRTDSSGGHRDNKNKSGLGSYHYHCGGHPAHLHKNGVCPYSTSTTSSTSNNTKSNKKTTSTSSNKAESTTNKKNSKKTENKSSVSAETVKKVQKELNKLGYDCGEVDGKCGKKTKAALKKFQKDNDLKVDGVIGKQVKKALNIS
ncbi:MAG TPA: YHYH domain-containing protein [Lachnospiraceae bacterium]|nr:YHYH domain-containing protein [Lachnospiraceae bacterium]HCM11897.1 YHYH domain-containing protein [Lachnospiraceae bacterium]